MNVYRKDFDKTRYMSLLIKDDTSWIKLAIALKKDLIVNLHTILKHLKTHASFHKDRIPKEDS